MENNESVLNEETLTEPANVEKVSLAEISAELKKDENKATEDLVRRIMSKILEIK